MQWLENCFAGSAIVLSAIYVAFNGMLDCCQARVSQLRQAARSCSFSSEMYYMPHTGARCSCCTQYDS